VSEGAAVRLLGRDEVCWLIRRRSDGHLALTEGALPVLVPVVYRLDDDELTVWAGPGLSPRVPDRHEVVAFQTGAHDPVSLWAWSVLVQGRAHPLAGGHGPTAGSAPPRTTPAGWPGWSPSGVFEVHMDLVSGWMVGDSDVASDADDR
jgi:nitroimidazol reductase NimA-like FMN-containing flavoprotein (pyridoxamine 5'-phosphate oxidase superfamily)